VARLSPADMQTDYEQLVDTFVVLVLVVEDPPPLPLLPLPPLPSLLSVIDSEEPLPLPLLPGVLTPIVLTAFSELMIAAFCAGLFCKLTSPEMFCAGMLNKVIVLLPICAVP
jgi:hypothetical protein